jgi:hypothetical protein
MISEMRNFVCIGITEAAAAKAVDLATKSSMTSLHLTHGLGILKLYFDFLI